MKASGTPRGTSSPMTRLPWRTSLDPNGLEHSGPCDPSAGAGIGLPLRAAQALRSLSVGSPGPVLPHRISRGIRPTGQQRCAPSSCLGLTGAHGLHRDRRRLGSRSPPTDHEHHARSTAVRRIRTGDHDPRDHRRLNRTSRPASRPTPRWPRALPTTRRWKTRPPTPHGSRGRWSG